MGSYPSETESDGELTGSVIITCGEEEKETKTESLDESFYVIPECDIITKPKKKAKEIAKVPAKAPEQSDSILDQRNKLFLINSHFEGKFKFRIGKGGRRAPYLEGVKDQLGVTTLIENYAKVEHNYKYLPHHSQYEEVFSAKWNLIDPLHACHDSVTVIFDMLFSLDICVMSKSDFIVTDLVCIPKSPGNTQMTTPYGAIDLIGYDIRNKVFVVADLKARLPTTKMDMKSTTLKMKNVLQVQYYSYLLESMARQACVEVKVGYTLLICYDENLGMCKVWKMPYDPEFYLKGTGIKDLWNPIL